MQFNSFVFIFIFLPGALTLFHVLRYAQLWRSATLSLVVGSLLFYAWWNPLYVLLLIPLATLNYIWARFIIEYRATHACAVKTLLAVGVAANLGVLGYYKYAHFFVVNFNAWTGSNIFLEHIILPLGISFFTFQKIAFLVDAYKGRVGNTNCLDFMLFVSFFPQLIAGPIVHHSEVLPQFRQTTSIPAVYWTMGLTIFTIGLAKKVLLADTAALYATPVFDAAAQGAVPDFLGAWSAALAYTAQLYFDFSGYSDMAIGLGLFFGIRLPVNFASPYKAKNMIDFWRGWHMTLSRFLRDYLYIPLGGNKKGPLRRYVNLIITMFLGGLWHGANWTFVIWGMLHGLYLVINHAWRACRARYTLPVGHFERSGGMVLTFLAVVVAWVFFRAANTETALTILQAMVSFPGALMPLNNHIGLAVATSLLALAWLAPNTQELTHYAAPESFHDLPRTVLPPTALTWRLSWPWALFLGLLLAACIANLSKVSEFIYFQF